MQPTPTLLVFTLGASRDAERRRLLPARLRPLEVGVHEACLEAALDAGRACGCRLEVCSPAHLDLPEDVHYADQTGSGFGLRLERALGDAFERGEAPVLVVGTDVPGLGARHLARALESLAADPDRVVLGPSPDGGFYLLAASRPIPGLGTAVRWCRPDTLRSLVRALRAAGRPVTLLDPLEDLDRPADLDRWLAARSGHAFREIRWRALVSLLRRALAAARRPLPAVTPGLRPAFAAAVAGRSPPAALPR
jgi:2-phospho-L-lactate guanylyltransferase (CobY/MobA/RfbA family)